MVSRAIAPSKMATNLSALPTSTSTCCASSWSPSARQSSTSTSTAQGAASSAVRFATCSTNNSNPRSLACRAYTCGAEHELGCTSTSSSTGKRRQSTITASAASKSRIASLFPADEYADVWSSSPSSSPSPNSRRIPPLLCPELDRPTRFLLSLLDDSINGIRRGKDKATTARCHRQLKRLADTSIGGRRLEGR